MENEMNSKFEQQFHSFEVKMKDIGLPEPVINKFKRYYRKLVHGETGMITREKIQPVTDLPDADELSGYKKAGKKALQNTAVIKLNGGLGTSMGLESAKSLIKVKEELTFLDIIASQILYFRRESGSDLPIIFMNSKNTQADTLQYLEKYPALEGSIPLDFIQLMVPKVSQEDLSPVIYQKKPELEWCPAGHGDIYDAMKNSGILEKLLSNEYKYAFVSNSDNLGAVLDVDILGYFAEEQFPFMMEAADRTPIDRKGGHLAKQHLDGSLMLREIAQCPDEEKDEFQNIEVYKYFNTNTIWINLISLANLLEKEQHFDLPLIRNKKTVDPADSDSAPVYQMETAMGAALSLYPNASALRVPRSRFLPVKTCQDLVSIWSDAYVLTDDFSVKLHKDQKQNVITQLDQRYYKLISDIESRFPSGVPSLVSCSKWVVRGDIKFGRNIVLKGSVEICNWGTGQGYIPDETQIIDSVFNC